MSAGSINLTIRQTHSGNAADLIARVEANTRRVADNYADRVQTSAQRRAPVRTGYLRSSITKVRTGPNSYNIMVGAFYGIYVEYGTRHMAPQPYFRPAIEEAKVLARIELAKVFR